jgi:hypothetical protein
MRELIGAQSRSNSFKSINESTKHPIKQAGASLLHPLKRQGINFARG